MLENPRKERVSNIRRRYAYKDSGKESEEEKAYPILIQPPQSLESGAIQAPLR